MGKISKLMKLLSASAVVAGANSVALADCGLCGGSGHNYWNCSGFDYPGFGRSIGYYDNRPEGTPLTEADKLYLGQVAANAKNKAEVLKEYLHASSSIVSFPTSSSDVASLNNTWSNPETTPQNSSEKLGASDKINTLKFEREQDLEDRNTAVSESDAEQIAKQMRREETALKIQNARRDQLARQEREEARREREETERSEAVQHFFGEDNMKTLAREHDTKELKNMLAERRETARNLNGLGKTLDEKNKYYINELYGIEGLEANAHMRGAEEARLVAEENREKINISEDDKLDIKARNILDGEQKKRERAAAKKITEALRANKKRKEAQRQAQIAGDYELAKKLQAEEVNAQIESDRQLAERLQQEYDAEDAQIRAERFAEEQRRLEEEEARQARILEEQEHAEREAEERLFAENRRKLEELEREHQLASEATDSGVADEEVEKDRWSLPRGMSSIFTAAFSPYNDYASKVAEEWAQQLEGLSIRKIECIFWLITTSYQQLQNVGKYAPTAQMAEAISDVCSIFPYSGTNSGVMNVYNAFENTDTAKFVGELERLGTNGLDGVLYYVAFRYMQLLEDKKGQKQAASSKFVELAKAVLERFGIGWNTEDVKFVPDNKDVREAPRDPVNFKAADKGIVETEAPETMTWNPPYRVYYAYCGNLKHGLSPSRRSMELFQDKENREQVYQDALSKLTIRRLETIIYLAATAYECRATEGYVDINKAIEDINKAIEDVRNVFPEDRQAQPNARVVNVWNALANMVDKPNDNPISMQPFQKGFTALTRIEQERAFIDMAIAYRKKLREGKRPASMAFVRLADAICKVSGNDGFVDGKDNVHPELKFEEFGNEAKTAQVSDTANANNNPAVTTDDEKEAPDSTL